MKLGEITVFYTVVKKNEMEKSKIREMKLFNCFWSAVFVYCVAMKFGLNQGDCGIKFPQEPKIDRQALTSASYTERKA